jgi:hypothetical protein
MQLVSLAELDRVLAGHTARKSPLWARPRHATFLVIKHLLNIRPIKLKHCETVEYPLKNIKIPVPIEGCFSSFVTPKILQKDFLSGSRFIYLRALFSALISIQGLPLLTDLNCIRKPALLSRS